MEMPETDESNCRDLQAVLLGWHKSGKTSVINNILGPSAAVAVSGQCVQKEGCVNGRRITLVDTPGWWKGCCVRDSAELAKQAIVRSVSLCPPGPDAFLLVIEADLPFKEKYMKPLEQRIELLTEKVWSHTIVLFTGRDSLINIEEHIQSQGEPLQTLLKKCGNRYHVFNANKHSSTQVTELFEKIDDTVRLNCGRHFEIDLEVLQGLQRKWEEVQQRAAVRQEKVQEERSMIKKQARVHLEELEVVLLGWVMSGKSSAGNIILNKKDFVTKTRTTTCEERSGNAAGRKITVLDTPGWWKFFTTEFNPESIQATILKAIAQSEKFPHALLMVVPADTSFKEEHRRTIEENMAIFGEQIWRHTIVLFTSGDFLGDASIEHHIESEGEALQWLVNKCGNRYHTFDKTKSGDSAQVTELLEKIEEMVAGNCLFRPGVRELYEKKTELPVDTYEKHEAEEILKLIQKEWNKRAMEFQENVKKLYTEIPGRPRKSNRSRTPPPDFSEKDDSPDSRKVSGCVREMEDSQMFSNQVSESLTEQLRSLMEREWSRQEAMVMEKVQACILEASEGPSEVGEDEICASVEKVLWWLPGCEQAKETRRSSNVYMDPEGGM